MRPVALVIAFCGLGVTTARAQVPVEPFVRMEVASAHEGYVVRLTLVAPVAAPFDLTVGTVLHTEDDSISDLVVGEDVHVSLDADERREVFVRAYRLHEDRYRPLPGMPLVRSAVDPRLARMLRDLQRQYERETRRSFERLLIEVRRRRRRLGLPRPPLDVDRLVREHVREHPLPNAQRAVWACVRRPASEPCEHPPP